MLKIVLDDPPKKNKFYKMAKKALEFGSEVNVFIYLVEKQGHSQIHSEYEST